MNADVAQKVERFFGNYRSKKYPKGQILILNGDNTDYVYHLIEGRVKQYDVTYRGDEIILNIFKPPAFFPMSLAINNAANPYIYETETNVVLQQAPANEVVDWLKSDPDVLFDLLSRVYRGVDGLLGRLTQTMANSAHSRLIYDLIVVSRRFGKKLADGSCVVSMSEKDLGAHTGLTRETISREMSKLKREGFIQIQGREIVIKKLKDLEKKIGYDI